MEKGKIIVLNGVSSSGKTTLAKVLQERLPNPYFHMDVDTFCLMAPEKFILNDYSLQHNFVVNMFSAVKVFADMGFNLVVPVALLEGYGFLENCVNLLYDYPVLLAHVSCPIDELKRREIERGDRQLGSAESMISMLVPQKGYDIVVDTYKHTTEECADRIIELLEYPEKITALKTLWQRRTN